MSLKSALIALAGNVGKCQENARSLKLELERGLLEVADGDLYNKAVTVTADGVKTYSAILDSLYAEAIKGVGNVLVVYYPATGISYHAIATRQDASSIEYEELRYRTNGTLGRAYQIKESSSVYYQISDGTASNKSTDVPAEGVTFTLYK